MFKVKRRRSKSNSKGSSNNSGGNGSASGGGSACGSATSGGGIGGNSSVSSSRPGSDGSSNQSHASKLKSCLRRPSSSDNSFAGGAAGVVAVATGIANFIAGEAGSSEDCSGSYRSQGNNSASAASSAQSSGGDASVGTFSHQSQQSFPQQHQKTNGTVAGAASNGTTAHTPSWNVPAVNAMATTPFMMSNKKARKRVGFQTVQVREYERVIGDNPSCSNGAPIR